MAYIYKITNQLNQKSYIGKTQRNLEVRWQEHLKNYHKGEFKNRPLYAAFKKYGIENFVISILEEVPDENWAERERFWIEFYKSYGNSGYNATIGGEGSSKLDYNKIIEDYKNYKNISEVAKINNAHPEYISDILKENGIEIISGGKVTASKTSKKVKMLDRVTLEVLFTFSSQTEAARYLIKNNLTGIVEVKSASSKISLVCRGKRKTFAGYIWKY